jgi:hypothetical protein
MDIITFRRWDFDQCDGEIGTVTISDKQLSMLKAINPICADCGRDDPNWLVKYVIHRLILYVMHTRASMNNCIMICIECCGVHRSMGTHISKVSIQNY